MTTVMQLAVSLGGSFCFGILFNLRGKRLAAAAVGGLLSWGIYLLLGCWMASEPLNYFITAAAISLYAEGMARLLRTPATPLVTTALIPLVPGGAMYYTMAYAFEQDLAHFAENAASTLQLAAALALGILVVGTLVRYIFPSRRGVDPQCPRKQK